MTQQNITSTTHSPNTNVFRLRKEAVEHVIVATACITALVAADLKPIAFISDGIDLAKSCNITKKNLRSQQ